jgi:hypothetical protein
MLINNLRIKINGKLNRILWHLNDDINNIY